MEASGRRQIGQTQGPAPDPRHERVELVSIAAYVAARVRRTSLRSVAEAIGISKSTVDALVQAHNGRREMPEPHDKTRSKLREWYLREKYAEAGELRDGPDLALLALEFLADVPDSRRARAFSGLVAYLRSVYDADKLPYNRWLNALIAAEERHQRGGG